ncbi:MAG: methyltransferase family protein [Chloroflexota bacterium]
MDIRHFLETRDPAAPVVPPPVIAGLTGLGAVALGRLSGHKRILPGWTRPIGAGAIVAGLAFAIWGLLHFNMRDADPNPMQRPTRFVTDGPYQLSRNPMYTGTTLVLAGLGLLKGSIPTLLSPIVYAFVLQKGQIAFEESALREAYGEEYEEYKRRVRRWL